MSRKKRERREAIRLAAENLRYAQQYETLDFVKRFADNALRALRPHVKERRPDGPRYYARFTGGTLLPELVGVFRAEEADRHGGVTPQDSPICGRTYSELKAVLARTSPGEIIPRAGTETP